MLSHAAVEISKSVRPRTYGPRVRTHAGEQNLGVHGKEMIPRPSEIKAVLTRAVLEGRRNSHLAVLTKMVRTLAGVQVLNRR